MSDIDRIRQMVGEGRITEEEGDHLINVLREVDAGGANFSSGAAPQSAAPSWESEQAAAPYVVGARDYRDSTSDAFGPGEGHEDDVRDAMRAVREAARSSREATRNAARAARDAAKAARHATRDVARGVVALAHGSSPHVRPGRNIAPAGTRWVTVEMLAGNLTVDAVEGLQRPEIDASVGNPIVEDTEDGYRIRFAPERGGPLDRFLSNVRSGSFTVRIGRDHGLMLKATAGDVSLNDVRYLQGQLTAGDLSASPLEGVDFTTMAGDVSVTLRLRDGEHALTSAAGDVNVVLAPDSDVTVDGSVSIGDASSDFGGISSNRHGLGERIEGTLGRGAATLRLRVTTGDLNIRVDGPEEGYQ